ncbi:MAG: YheU family protein [Porticoccaceae bacterium]|nr:YheU family protein [Porticoccaceae bacterium]
MIEIPFKRLDAEILSAVIEEFILREGTDYGAWEVSLEDKIAQVRGQLENGDVLITFDPRTENCTLLTRQQFLRNTQADVQDTRERQDSSL